MYCSFSLFSSHPSPLHHLASASLHASCVLSVASSLCSMHYCGLRTITHHPCSQSRVVACEQKVQLTIRYALTVGLLCFCSVAAVFRPISSDTRLHNILPRAFKSCVLVFLYSRLALLRWMSVCRGHGVVSFPSPPHRGVAHHSLLHSSRMSLSHTHAFMPLVSIL